MTKRLIGALASIGALAAIAGLSSLAALASRAPTNTHAIADPPPTPIPTLAITPQPQFITQRAFSGEARPKQRSLLGFPQHGRIVLISIEAGQPVKTQQLLARTDDRALQAQKQQLAAAIAAAQARLDELQAGPRPQTIAAARARLAQAEALRELAHKRRARIQQLFDSQSASADDLDDAISRLQASTAERDALQHSLDELNAGTRDEQLRGQAAELTRLQAELAALEVALDDTLLRAPYDGTIAERAAHPGDIAQPGQTILSLLSDELEARIGLPPELLGEARLAPGATLTLTTTDDRAIPATVTGALPDLDPQTRLATLILSLDGGQARPGELLRLTLERPVPQAGAWLPLAALSTSLRGLWSCYTLAPDGEAFILKRCELEVLHLDGDRAFVRGPLAPGQLIAAAGLQKVVPGQRVTPANTR